MSSVREYEFNEFDGRECSHIIGVVSYYAMVLKDYNYTNEEVIRILNALFNTDFDIAPSRIEKLERLISVLSQKNESGSFEGYLKLINHLHRKDSND